MEVELVFPSGPMSLLLNGLSLFSMTNPSTTGDDFVEAVIKHLDAQLSGMTWVSVPKYLDDPAGHAAALQEIKSVVEARKDMTITVSRDDLYGPRITWGGQA